MDDERTILVVDDETDVTTTLESMLADRDYTIRQASRWTEAIAQIQENRPVAVLLDLYLPTVQGEALLEFIRDLDATLPVVIVSSEIDPTRLEHLGRMGANGFVRKPFEEDDLFLVVEQILSDVEQRTVAEAPAAPAPVPEPVSAAAERSRSAPPRVDPGAGVEKVERQRPEVETAPARRKRRRSKKKTRLRGYVIAFLFCLVATWLLFVAQDMLSQGFFGMDFQDTREQP